MIKISRSPCHLSVSPLGQSGQAAGGHLTFDMATFERRSLWIQQFTG